MKRILALLLVLCMAVSLCACGGQDTQTPDTEPTGSSLQETTEPSETPDITETQNNRVLIVYYSYSGVTDGVARILQEKTGGDLFELVPVEPYPDDMYEASDRAAQELESGNLPELLGQLPDLSGYELILVGGPVWSQKAAPPLAAYLSQTNFEGKTVAPFWTYNNNEGAYEEDVTGYIQNANIGVGLGLPYASSMEESELNMVLDHWLGSIGDAQMNADTQTAEITITIGDQVIEATLNDSPAAKEFGEMLPLSLSMTRMGEHEYYGSLPQPLTHSEDVQTGYTVGDLAFWTPGDLFAFYFDEPENDPDGLMILGRITSDLSVFNLLGNPEEVHIEWKRNG